MKDSQYFCQMIQIDDTLISDEIFEKKFVCDLSACKGECCVAGDSGAPLVEDELEILDEIYDKVKPYMRKEGIEAVEKIGVFEVDYDGEYVTPLVNHEECAYVVFDENNSTKCAIENAYLDGVISWKKPMSCHLYPIRVTKYEKYDALNYHQWKVCKDACTLGEELGIRVYKFLKEPLIRLYGKSWYAQLEAAFDFWKKEKG